MDTRKERQVNVMAHTITMKEIQELIKRGVGTFERKNDSPRGCECVSASEIKLGDKVVLNNYFTTIIE